MTDEQWVWLLVNQMLDNEEKLDKMCDACREDVTSGNKCIRCGKDLGIRETYVNPNFDIERYNRLARGEE